MTAAEALRAVTARLRAAGIDGAGSDARALVAHALDIAPDRLVLHLEDLVPMAKLEPLVAARLARQPVSQITGRRLFWSRPFRVTPDVLDPRPETETLVAEALRVPFARVLDLGTGSGCILLTLLAEREGATGLGVDLSSAALQVAAANRADLGQEARAALAEGSWYAPVTGAFDLIVANPPYIAESEMAALAPEVRDWEPRMALTPGGDGLDAYRTIAVGLRDHLLPGGRVLLEIGPTQGQAVTALLAAQGLTGPCVLRDLDGRDRVVAARAP